MLVFIKLGGSLITDKRQSQEFHADVMRQAAREIANARAAKPDLQLLIGHGSGSFGHVAAQKHGTVNGVQTAADWQGFAEVAVIARRLNSLVIEILHEAGLPVFPVQPSSSLQCRDGRLLKMDDRPIIEALAHGLIPVVYGDVGFDSSKGGTIVSTEPIFTYLAERLCPNQIMLLGEVEGVYDASGAIIPQITSGNFGSISSALGGSHGTDVTGGMASKVQQMVDLTQKVNSLQVRIFSGLTPGQIEKTLIGDIAPGTVIS